MTPDELFDVYKNATTAGPNFDPHTVEMAMVVIARVAPNVYAQLRELGATDTTWIRFRRVDDEHTTYEILTTH